jgi:hypothetical protein
MAGDKSANNISMFNDCCFCRSIVTNETHIALFVLMTSIVIIMPQCFNIIRNNDTQIALIITLQ